MKSQFFFKSQGQRNEKNLEINNNPDDLILFLMKISYFREDFENALDSFVFRLFRENLKSILKNDQ